MESDDSYFRPVQHSKERCTNLELVARSRISLPIMLSKDEHDGIKSKQINEPLPHSDKFDRSMIKSIGDVAKFVQECASSNRDVSHQAIHELRQQLIYKHKLCLHKLLELNIVDILVSHLVNGETYDVKYDAAWVLGYVSNVDSHQSSFLIKESVVAALSSVLCDKNPSLVEQSILTLSNIIKIGPASREFVLQTNILTLLKKPLDDHYKSITVMKQLSLMLKKICHKKHAVVPLKYVPQIIAILDVLLAHQDENILDDILWSYNHLADSSSDHVSLIIASGIVDKVYKFLNFSKKLALNTLLILGNIASSIDEHTQYLLDHNILVHLDPLLNTANPNVKREIYWVLSNLAGGTHSQIRALLSWNNFPQIIKDLEIGEYGVRREACWVISNIVHKGTYQDVQPLVESKLLYSMKSFLQSQDYHMVVNILETVVVLLRLYSSNNNHEYMRLKIKESGVLRCIKYLQTSSHETIRSWVSHILTTYFTEDQETSVYHEEISNFDGEPFGADEDSLDADEESFDSDERPHIL